MNTHSPEAAEKSSTVQIKFDFNPINYDRFERICLLLDLDPDKVRKGEQEIGQVELSDPFQTGAEMLAIMLTEDSDTDLSRYEKPAAEELVAFITAGFFFECFKHFEKQKIELHTMLTGAAFPPSKTLLQRAFPSPVAYHA